MKGVILNQTLDAAKELGVTGGAAEVVLEAAKGFGQDVVGTAGRVLADMLKSSVSGGGDSNITR